MKGKEQLLRQIIKRQSRANFNKDSLIRNMKLRINRIIKELEYIKDFPYATRPPIGIKKSKNVFYDKGSRR